MNELKRTIEIWLGCKIYGHHPQKHEVPLSREVLGLLSAFEKVAARLTNQKGGLVYGNQTINITTCARCGKRLK